MMVNLLNFGNVEDEGIEDLRRQGVAVDTEQLFWLRADGQSMSEVFNSLFHISWLRWGGHLFKV